MSPRSLFRTAQCQSVLVKTAAGSKRSQRHKSTRAAGAEEHCWGAGSSPGNIKVRVSEGYPGRAALDLLIKPEEVFARAAASRSERVVFLL